jgi:Tol biopolymer transport system component
VSPGHGDEDDRLFASNTDGSDRVQLADIHAEYPSWSPDGRAVAFDDGRNLIGTPFSGPNGDVYVVGADGSDLRQVSLDGGVAAPSWSPDSDRLAVAAARSDGAAGISWLDVSTGELTPVTTNPFGFWDGEPDVSPDGDRVAFIRIRQLQVSDFTRHLAAVFTVNADGTGLRRLTSWTSDAATPTWSPDGGSIAFNTNDHFDPDRTQRIVVVDADGSGGRTLVRSGADEGSYWPAWSPDGSNIVFTRASTTLVRPSQLFIVPARGGDAVPFLSEPQPNQADWTAIP